MPLQNSEVIQKDEAESDLISQASVPDESADTHHAAYADSKGIYNNYTNARSLKRSVVCNCVTPFTCMCDYTKQLSTQ